MGGGISAPPPTHPGLCFAPPIPWLDQVGRIEKNKKQKNKTRIAGERVYTIGASVVVGTARGPGHFERVFARSLAQTRQFTSKADLVHLAPTRANVLLAT